jgi:hypothetical protein
LEVLEGSDPSALAVTTEVVPLVARETMRVPVEVHPTSDSQLILRVELLLLVVAVVAADLQVALEDLAALWVVTESMVRA